tara:strand:+ start:1827 stop:1961 length:135 start_codon:yes stop_codon:yes gene_type:complete
MVQAELPEVERLVGDRRVLVHASMQGVQREQDGWVDQSYGWLRK